MIQPNRIAFAAYLIVALTISPIWACKFCPPDAGPTVLRQLDTAKASVLAELVQRADLKAKNPVTRYRVAKVLKGKSVKKGDVFDVPLDVQSPLGSVHLFFGADQTGKWRNPLGVSSEARTFLDIASNLPTLREKSSLDDRLERLATLLPLLASTDQQVAESAHGEFSAAPYGVIKELKMSLDHQQLAEWIQLKTTTPANRRLLFQLLGLCNNPYDIFVVSDAMEDRLKSGQTTDLDSILAAFITLRGTKGLDEIERRLLNRQTPLAVKRAATAALRFHAEQATGTKRIRIIKSCRLLLRNPKTADFVIGDLARWQDWESLDVILELWSTQVSENRWLEQPILSYLEACPLPAARQALSLIHKPGR